MKTCGPYWKFEQNLSDIGSERMKNNWNTLIVAVKNHFFLGSNKYMEQIEQNTNIKGSK